VFFAYSEFVEELVLNLLSEQNKTMRQRVAAIIIKDDKILLIRRFKDGKEYFVFPGGGIEKGESPEEVIVREAQEELGLKIEIEKLLFKINNLGNDEFYFLVKEFSGTPKLGGPEKERMSKNNQYFIEWKKLSEISNLSNLYPEEARRKVEKF